MADSSLWVFDLVPDSFAPVVGQTARLGGVLLALQNHNQMVIDCQHFSPTFFQVL
jgi:hypothetical protein